MSDLWTYSDDAARKLERVRTLRDAIKTTADMPQTICDETAPAIRARTETLLEVVGLLDDVLEGDE